MSQPQKKRKWKAYEKKNKKEAATVILQSKLKNLDQIFADSSGDEDGSNHDSESYQGSADEGKAMARNKSVRSDIVSTSNRVAIKDHSEEQSCSSSSGSSGSSFPLRKQSTYSSEEDKEEQEDSTSENEDSSQPTDEEEDEDSGAEQRNSEDEDEDEDFLVSTTETTKAQNMARAIARILGESSSSNHDHTKQAVILSKTRTKLQKLQSEALEEKKALSLKRSERKQNNLSSMYIPPPIHSNSNSNKGYPSAASSTKKVEVAQELQNDRTYRRIATRGVVALFNAIAQHQREQKQEVTVEESSDKKNNSAVTSQREFIQKIKESTVTKQQSTQMAKINTVHENKIRSTNSTNKKSTGWSALKDDYMMSSNNLKVSLSSDT